MSKNRYGILELKKETIYLIALMVGKIECFIKERYDDYVEFLEEAVDALYDNDKKIIEIVLKNYKELHESRFK